jgi:hypothetical protein
MVGTMMHALREKLDKWLFRYFNNFSLNQVNSLAIVFILTFTVLFSYPLIQAVAGDYAAKPADRSFRPLL